ncbi:OapA N-terminal domain-containing protein [Stenotrophomonas maltophilia]|uniref:OapA N-terminal domain-containing protein n=1 Tax=Stenotrophomonas maltophilia TaxID=40324 RepID=UPI000DA8A302|nr:OapA N-terminal domain-containing protein [Stenotrophomonas maltophilia]
MAESGKRDASVRFSMHAVSWHRITILVLSALVLLLFFFAAKEPGGLSISEGDESVADWVAAVGTWLVGYGAMAIAWRAGQREELDQKEAREKSRKEEFASLFGVLSIARRSVEAAEDVTEYFKDTDGLGLPRRTTLWVLSRLTSKLDEIRGRELNLSVLSESDQELIFDLEEEASWIAAVAADLADEIGRDDKLAIKGHYAVDHLIEASDRLTLFANQLIESTTKRRAELS